MWSDSETELDFLNFTGVADTVAEIVVQAQGSPISIGVSGAWGVGKSSMIRLIRRSLGQRKNTDFIFVEFNAWLYQGYDDARAALMEVIANKLAKEAESRQKGIDKAKEFLKRINWFRAAKLMAGSAISMSLGMPPIGLLGEIYGIGEKLIAGDVDEKTASDIEHAASGVAGVASGLLAAKKKTSPPKEIQALRDSFEETLAEMEVTLVVLIDDLDRCLPETTISTLEAIRLFLFLKNTAFVIAADDAMIKHAVRRHFGDVDGDNAGCNATETITSRLRNKLTVKVIEVPPDSQPDQLSTEQLRCLCNLPS